MSNESDDLALATLRKALEATGSSSWRLAAGPCCEAMARVETSPGNATTLVGWTCPVHGLTVRGTNATDGFAYRTARADWIRRAAEFLGPVVGGGGGTVSPMPAVGGPGREPPWPLMGAVSTTETSGSVPFKATFTAGELGAAPMAGAPGAAPANPDHPAPWRWQGNELDGWSLLDATAPIPRRSYEEGLLLRAIDTASPLARELIRLAPEMADLLRKHEWAGERGDVGEFCAECMGVKPVQDRSLGDLIEYGVRVGHREDCKWAGILAALDAARAVKL